MRLIFCLAAVLLLALSTAAGDTAPGFVDVRLQLPLTAETWKPVFYEGTGRAGFGGNGVTLALDCKAAALFPRRPLPEVTGPRRFTVQAELLDGTAEIRFLVVGRDGREFRFPWRALKPGKNTVAFPFDGEAAAVEPPLRLTGVSVRTGGKATLRLEQAELESNEPEINRIELAYDRAYPINIETPDGKHPVALQLRNPLASAVKAQWKLEVREPGKEPVRQEGVRELPPGETVRLPLPPAERNGIRYGTLELAAAALPEVVRRESFSVARMNPAGPTPGRAEGFLFGVCGHPQRYPAEDQRREAAAAALCGAKVLREDAGWGHIQPSREAWNFDSLDETVRIFGEQGIELELIYSFTPAWAVAADWKPLNEQRRQVHNSRPDYEAWREFVKRTAARYRDQIRFFEVWNEPDLFSFANFTAEEYLRMLKIAGEETHKAAPGALVLTGGYTCMPPYFALNDQKHQEKTLADGRGYYDIHAFHGHGPLEHYAPQIERMIAMRERLGVAAPWWANETAETSVFLGEAGQADTLWKKLFFSWANGSIGYNWYDLRNDGFDPRNVEHNFGMITHDFFPKAIYPAYNTIVRNFRGAEFDRALDRFPALRLYRFQKGKRRLLAGWNDSPDSGTRLIAFTAGTGKGERFDLFDNRSPLAVAGGKALVPVGREPAGVELSGGGWEPLCEPVLPLGPATLRRGGNPLALQLENPLDVSAEMRLAFRLPAGNVHPAETIRLAPREKRRITVEFTAAENVPAENPGIAIDVRIGGLAGTLTLPVRPSAVIGPEFSAGPDFRLDRPEQLTVLVPADPGKVGLFWQGPQDLSAALSLAMRNGVLKLRAEVTDDIHCQPFRGEAVWQGDNIQFALAVPGQKTVWTFGLTRLADGVSECHVWDAPKGFDSKAVAAEMRLETSRDEVKKLTVYEAELPLSAIGADSAKRKQGIRFNLLVNDNDGEMRESYLALTPGLGEGRRPDAYYLLSFQ